MKRVLFCDFDGTIVTIDTCEYLLDKFVKEEWRNFDTYYERGEITFEECIQKQFSKLKVSEELMLKELDKVTSFRLHFMDLVKHCDKKGISFIVVSAGLDFIIRHFLDTIAWDTPVKIYSAKSRFTDKGIKLAFPELFNCTSLDFKEDLVNHYKKQGFRTFYLGDGLSDFNAVRSADFSFVIMDSKLAKLCKREKLPHLEINDFQEVINAL